MKKIRFNKTIFLSILIVCCALLTLTSCGNTTPTTLYAQETTTKSGCSTTSSMTKYDWIISKINNNVAEDYTTYETYIKESKGEASSEYQNVVATKNEIMMNGVTYTDNDGKEITTSSYIENAIYVISNYALLDNMTASYNVALIKEAQVNYIGEEENVTGYIKNITTADETTITDIKAAINGTAGCLDVKTESVEMEAIDNVAEVTDVYRLVAVYIMDVDNISAYLEPITFRAASAGDFFSHLWNNLFIFPLAWLMYAISSLCGGYYLIGLIIVTLLVRTLGWPIYAKSNAMTAKMGEMQPELQKIQDKYAGRQDQESQRMMQMEQAQLYKKYKVGIGGCIAPFLQFPIFMAIYRAVTRIPYTRAIAGTIYTNDWANQLKSTMFGLNLFENRSVGGTSQLVGVIILVIITIGTQVLSQLLTQKRQKDAAAKKQEDIPAYRRQAYNQTQNQSAQSMKMMMWMMILMMGVFVWTSKAGLGIYWCIGNVYSIGQMIINDKLAEKKAEKKKNEKGIFTVNPEKDSSKKTEKKKK